MLHPILMAFALVLFVLAEFGVGQSRLNLVALGLACWVASLLL